MLEACYKMANEVYAELSQTKQHFKKLYESRIAYRSDGNLWFQVAEMSFGGFMVRMRTRT